MRTVNASRFGLGLGIGGALLDIACVLFTAIGGQSATVFLFNSVLHGLDVSSVVRLKVPPGQTIFGLAETFMLAWVLGAVTAAIYNSLSRPREPRP